MTKFHLHRGSINRIKQVNICCHSNNIIMATKLFLQAQFPSLHPGTKSQLPNNYNVPIHVVTLTHVGTSVYLGQTHLRTPLQVPAWVRKFSLGSTGQARRKHFGSGAAIGTKKTAGGLGAP